ncbi:OmpA family protein [Oceaniglobus trochenteri]|uniref:OmpA family protein n=1 Tax=Oceaniglobus trochenteri TaxID=2763260 RepID=UPI001CFFE0A4|nr:OmpA family protein [Oceaniglobus trochenteri]
MGHLTIFRTGFRTLTLAGGLAGLCATAALAQDNPFSGGWTLKSDSSALRFQSVKNATKVETSSFASFDGTISEDGTAKVTIKLDSVDTKVDLRNVRMRFLFFETFQFPEAVITARIDPADLADLNEVRRKIIMLPYTLDLHGVKTEGEAEVAVTLISDTLVAVASSTPISVATADHDLDNGIRKLEEAANVEIVPSATVSFDMIFGRAAPDAPAPATVAAAQPETPPASAAVETAGNFDLAACKGRFEILSRTDNINFRSGSATLEQTSFFLLDSIVDIVRRCPGLKIEVGGHTDSLGGAASNQRLSERRAASVTDYLISKGVDRAQITSTGYGEARPIVDNDTAENQRRNRRIEFTVLNG